jgi:hypothetical protein
MIPARNSATYLYCLVEAARRPSLSGAPAGLPGTGALCLLPAGEGLWLVAAEAPLALYGREPIERGLRDLEWVTLRGAAHARVIEHFARRFTTVPMKLFTLFTTDDRAVAHVRGDARRVRRVLARVAGRQEWGLRVRVDPALARRRARPRPAAGARRAGTRFLLARKRQLDVAREGRVAVEAAFRALAALSAAAHRRPAAELDATPVVLDAALLVDAERRRGFQRAVREAATTLAALGYRLSATGPWPAYNFVSDGR